jgi:superfamily II DNA or RNA helicase
MLHCKKATKTMARLEDLKAGAYLKGLIPGGTAKVIHLEGFGDQAVKVTYEDPQGHVSHRLVFRNEEPTLELVTTGRPGSFDGDGHLLRLASEAYRIRLAYLFDPYLAIHTSQIEPLPHQITAVYGEMLPRQPLRFLLADDPGAGKTIMAGLLIKELIIRGDLERCLVVAPGSLVEQWQDELAQKFSLSFDILTRDQIEAARLGNPFEGPNLLIARLDMLSRNPDLQDKLQAAKAWDLIIGDEAHRMSATYFGGEVKFTKRYRLGQILGGQSRHFLLMSATPHNGKDEDFQLFMALLDGDRFEGRFRDGVHHTDPSDLMRRLTKEALLRFDATPLFPERRAYTVQYALSDPEAALYAAVTTYVRDEMNRVERFAEEGDDKRTQNVGFALQILQRRLASSPAAIHESLRRRRERLEKRLTEEKLLARGVKAQMQDDPILAGLSAEDLEDLEDAPEKEVEDTEERIIDRATAARTLAELVTEIATLKALEAQAKALRYAGIDTKWIQLNSILDDPLMVDAQGNRRKLIVFTEPKDTLHDLADKIRTRLGRPEAVVVIHGGIGREERRRAVEAFTHDKEVLVLVANDAAGEGINLQRAHLMVNYDLPWNPNRIEQRFGRIHRIGQREVCHLWNLVAAETREGAVYYRLLEKLETAREALGGRVYDVLGRLFEGNALRDLLVEAIRYGDQPEVKARLFQTLDDAVDQQRLWDLLAERALVHDALNVTQVAEIREQMERAEARRLQPHFIQAFFLEAFQHLGGRFHRREPGRWEISYVPGPLRDRDRLIGLGEPVLSRYERICFEKDQIHQTPVAAFVCPGHPLMNATLDLILERHRELLKRGAVLVDDLDEGEALRVLFYLEHALQDGRPGRHQDQQIISQRLQFVEYRGDGTLIDAGPAPGLPSYFGRRAGGGHRASGSPLAFRGHGEAGDRLCHSDRGTATPGRGAYPQVTPDR